MKVIYVNHTITTYTHPLLQKIVAKGCDLIMLIPGKENGTVGQGVEISDNANATYKIRYCVSKKGWFGKAVLTDMNTILIQENPDILMIGWPYMLQLFFDKQLRKIIENQGTKVIIQEIPFQTPPYGNLSYFKAHPCYNEDMKLISSGLGFKIRALMTMYIRKQIYKIASATVNYATCAYDILPSYGVKRESIFVRYNTIDTDALWEARKQIEQNNRMLSDRPRIIHVGRLVKWKRVDLLISAFEKVVKKIPDCELVVVGKGPEMESLKQQAASIGLANNVVFPGGIYDPMILGQYMYESSVYVLAGMGGLSINDAMGYSLPVICSVCDGTEKDLIKEGVNGHFFKEGDVNDLAEKIISVLSNPSKCKQMGKESYLIIRDKINLETVSQRYIDAFNYVMQQ